MDTTVKLLAVGMVLAMVLQTILAVKRCEECNCHISTNEADNQKVHTIGLVCNTGTVTWYGASGGILLELSPYIHGNFRACFLVESDKHTSVKVSQENAHVSRRSNYRLKRSAITRPRLDHVSTSAGKGKEFCVESTRRDPVLLFVESVKTPEAASVSKVLIHYDMEKRETSLDDVRHGSRVPDKLSECRPCTKEEILDHYCSSDFAVIGSLADVRDNLISGNTDITLAVKQIIHTAHMDRFQRVKRSDPHLTARVVAPTKCGIRMGEGDFLFTGRMRLTELKLKCSPYIHEWRQIQHEAECSFS